MAFSRRVKQGGSALALLALTVVTASCGTRVDLPATTVTSGPISACASYPLPADPGRKSPVVIASMCNCGGPVGSTAAPIVQGGQIWVKVINARGGLNGHPVRHIVYDDGGDPARNKALVREAVEREHAIAFF